MTESSDPFADPVEPEPMERIAIALERIARALGKIEGRIHDSNDFLEEIRNAIGTVSCCIEESRG